MAGHGFWISDRGATRMFRYPRWRISLYSPHSVDQLIRELIDSDRTATAEEIERIVERMATVPFNSRIFAVPVEDRGLTYQGQTLGAR